MMIEILYSPKWFYGRDITIDVISVFVLLLITFFAVQYYRLSRNKNYLYFALSFFLIALSFLAKILMNFTIYYESFDTMNYGFATITDERIISSDNMFFFGFLVYRFLSLLGLYALYSIYNKQPKRTMFFVIYMLLVSTYFSQSRYYVFHFTCLVLLGLIIMNYADNYKKNKTFPSLLLLVSFAIITLSQIGFIFIRLSDIFYAVSEVIQLIGFITLLVTFIMVLKSGKKKNKD